MNEDYPVYAKLSEQKLSQLGLEVTDLKASPLDYIDPAWDYANIFKLLVYFQGRVESTIGMVTDVETATTETDQKLSARLDELIVYLQSIRKKLK
jgi:hypothetical protein